MNALDRGDPLAWIVDDADAWSRLGLERRLVALGESTPGGVVHDDRRLINFASNDYLGLASDTRVIAAATEAAERYGWGSGASPLVSGWREPHEALASSLARFEGVEAVALFASGYAANLGTIAALVGSGDAVYADRLNHASLIDGARLGGCSAPRVPAQRRQSLGVDPQARSRAISSFVDRHRQRLQHGWRRRAPGRSGRPGRTLRRDLPRR